MTREDIAQYSYRYAGNWKAVEQAILQEEENPYYTVYECSYLREKKGNHSWFTENK